MDDRLVILLYVRENQGNLLLRGKYPNDAPKLGKRNFFALAGHGSVFEALFACSDVCFKPAPSALHIAN